MFTALYLSLSAFFFIFLSVRVIRQRRKHGVSVGAGDNADLERAMRVQANFAEYTPISLLMLAVIELQGAHWMVVNALGLLILAGRISHFIGFRSEDGPGKFRVQGMMLTFLTLTVQGILLISLLAVDALAQVS